MSINKEKLIEITSKLVEVESYLEDPKDFPNKKHIEVLEVFKDIAEELGFETKIDPNGNWGYAEIGKGDELIGIIGHLDVVGPGDVKLWKTPPFEATVIEDYIYGRGVIDDKGPVAISLLVMKQLLEECELNKRIRLIVGTDEEVLWRGIEEYKKTEEIPSIGFSPDSAFPMVYAEKELLQLEIKSKGINGFNATFGETFNKVPDKAEYDFGDLADEVENNAKEKNISYKRKDNKITFLGDSTHAKDAAGKPNAIVGLIKSLPLEFQNSLTKFISENVNNGEAIKIFGKKEDEPTGKLTFNIGKAVFTDDEIILSVDLRIPVVASSREEVLEIINKSSVDFEMEIIEYDYLPKVYSPLDSELVLKMQKAYKSVTGNEEEPVSSGGATYARTMPNFLAFGPRFSFEPGTEHKENEQMHIPNAIKAGDIYIKFLKDLLN